MNTKTPILSIIIPTKNRPNFLIEPVNIFSKFIPQIELIVIDDGSKIEDYEKNKLLVTKHGGKLFRNETSLGAPRARNIGSINSKGAYIWYFDDDDVPTAKTIIDILEYLTINEVSTLLLPMRLLKSSVEYKTIYPSLYQNNFNYYRKHSHQVNTSCAVFSKTLLESINYWDENLVSGQDTDLFYRASMNHPINILKTEPIRVNIGHLERISRSPKIIMKGYFQFLAKHRKTLSFRKKTKYYLRILLLIPYLKYFLYKILKKRERNYKV